MPEAVLWTALVTVKPDGPTTFLGNAGGAYVRIYATAADEPELHRRVVERLMQSGLRTTDIEETRLVSDHEIASLPAALNEQIQDARNGFIVACCDFHTFPLDDAD